MTIPLRANGFPEPYYTLLVPWSDKPTIWHPTERTGPFAVLTRGAFTKEAEAHAWAEIKLGGQPYSVRLIDDDGSADIEPT